MFLPYISDRSVNSDYNFPLARIHHLQFAKISAIVELYLSPDIYLISIEQPPNLHLPNTKILNLPQIFQVFTVTRKCFQSSTSRWHSLFVQSIAVAGIKIPSVVLSSLFEYKYLDYKFSLA